MARPRSEATPVDLVVTALSPALIAGVIASLVFFLAEVLYGGQYESRLIWTLFFLVVGMVLVGRIAIAVDRTRAAAYGFILAVVGYIALQVFVKYPDDSSVASFNFLINGVLIGVIWWCAQKLVTDCTFIDEARPSSDRGLLAVLGLETPNYVRSGAAEAEDKPFTKGSLAARYRKFKARRAKKPHTPGTSVIWFALAALPIFGLGQSLIPADAAARRSWTFQLAAIYVTSSLGLLLTTSFLGLRRYLRQRGLEMPGKITGSWLGLGSALVFGFVIVAAILPRPYSETPLIRVSKAGSADRKASDNAVMNDGAGKGEGRKGNETEAGDGKATAKDGKPGGQGKNAGDKGKGSGADKDKAGGGKDGDKDSGKGEGKSESKESQAGKKGEEKAGEKTDDKAGDKREAGKQKQGGRDGDRLQEFQSGAVGKVFAGLLAVLKWLLFLIVLLVVLAALFRNGLKYLANFMPWAQRLLDRLSAFWAGLFGRKAAVAERVRSEEAEAVAHRPFSDFRDPFETGLAEDIGLERSIEYSFEALEAWAADSAVPRGDSETPLEFAARLMQSHPQTEPGAGQLSQLLVRVAYSEGELPADAQKLLRDFWNRLEPPAA